MGVVCVLFVCVRVCVCVCGVCDYLDDDNLHRHTFPAFRLTYKWSEKDMQHAMTEDAALLLLLLLLRVSINLGIKN